MVTFLFKLELELLLLELLFFPIIPAATSLDNKELMSKGFCVVSFDTTFGCVSLTLTLFFTFDFAVRTILAHKSYLGSSDNFTRGGGPSNFNE